MLGFPSTCRLHGHPPHAPRYPQRHSRSGVAKRGGGGTGVEQALFRERGNSVPAPTLSGISLSTSVSVLRRSHLGYPIRFAFTTSMRNDYLRWPLLQCSIVFQVFGVWAWTADRGPYGGSSALHGMLYYPTIGEHVRRPRISNLGFARAIALGTTT